MIDAIENFAVALVLTIFAEWFIVYLFGFRDKKTFLAVMLVNLITNPLMNFFISFLQGLNLFAFNFFSLLIIELAVVVVEWQMLVYSLIGDSKKFLFVSLAMNMFSFSCGLILGVFFSPPFMRVF